VRTASFAYVRPRTLPDALAALGRVGAVALAGGQALVQSMKLQAATPTQLVDLNDLPGLDEIRDTGSGLEIGALVRVHQLIDSPVVALRAPALAASAPLLGDVQVRNRATVAGNVCFADPRANLSSALISLRAELVVDSSGGPTTLPVDAAFAGFRRSALTMGDMVTAIRIPAAAAPVRGTYRELARQQNGVPIVNVAVTLVGDPVTEAGVGVGGVATTPLRLVEVEEVLSGSPLASIDTAAVAALVTRGDAEPYEDMHAPAAYRLRVAAVLLRRALEDLKGDANV
jgi:carbon-monoxide dehydrogenase medium subunit